MALTFKQQQALINAKEQGLTREQAFARVFEMPKTERRAGRFSDIGEDIATTARGTFSGIQRRLGDVRDAARAPGQEAARIRQEGGTFGDAIRGGADELLDIPLVAGGNLVGSAVDIAEAPFMAAGRAALTQDEEEAVGGAVQSAMNATGLPQKLAEQTPRTQRNVIAGLSLFEGATAGVGAAVSRPFLGKVQDTVKKVTRRTDTPNTADDVVEQAQLSLERQAADTTLSPRVREEAQNAALTFKERYIGLTPDVKNRLQEMGEDKLKEYLDAVHIRNIDDTAPTPYEVGARNVQETQKILEQKLNDTGSEIGRTREQLAKIRVPQTRVEEIDRTFRESINNLDLQIRKGEVLPRANGITPASQGDINALNSLLNDLNTFKQSPTVENAIKLRKNFDAKIKFGKSARDVSNEVDPLARSVRAKIAETAADTVGKEKAELVTQFSEFMDAYGDLQSFTSRRAGGEYLLRLVLSGRGGEARRLIQTIKDYTGVDLMNDATAMKVATETLGNDNTRNLFRQEVSRAGYDAAAVLSGSPTGVVQVVGQRVLDRMVDPEDVLEKAARTQK